jgi:hypothetical protein
MTASMHVEIFLYLLIRIIMRSILDPISRPIAIRVMCTCDSQHDSCWYPFVVFANLGFYFECSFCVVQITLYQVLL